MVLLETNRAAVVALNAEIRRTKARLIEEVVKLQKLANKKVNSFWFTFLFRKMLKLEVGELWSDLICCWFFMVIFRYFVCMICHYKTQAEQFQIMKAKQE